MIFSTSISCFLFVAAILTAGSQFYEHKFGNSTTLNLESFYKTSYTVQCDAYEYFSVMFPYPCQDLIITLRPTQGNPEIYVLKADVNKDPYPTRDKLTWSASSREYYSLSIGRFDPESSPGIYYIGIYNNCDGISGTKLPAKFQIQAMESKDPGISYGLTDIYEYPDLGINQKVASNQYAHYRFCIPVCANVLITLHNCLDNKVCPKAYSFPELLVSRTSLQPSLKDYRYLASSCIDFLQPAKILLISKIKVPNLLSTTAVHASTLISS